MYDQQFEFLDMLAIISFGLQMEFMMSHNEQTTNDELMHKLQQIEQKLDKLLETIT